MKKLGDIWCWILAILCVMFLFFGMIIVITSYFHKDTPLEETVDVAAATKSRDSIKIVINNLDSIKNAKIIEVKALNNDSTVKLFYELIRED